MLPRRATNNIICGINCNQCPNIVKCDKEGRKTYTFDLQDGNKFPIGGRKAKPELVCTASKAEALKTIRITLPDWEIATMPCTTPTRISTKETVETEKQKVVVAA